MFKPIFKAKIWGGHKIKTILHKDFSPLVNCGESWEISGIEGEASIVENGVLAGRDLNNLLAEYQGQLLGTDIYNHFQGKFPLLIKFIDANEDLSIQVHPNDELAKKRQQGNGKTEMWYVIQADPKATLISGFNQPIDQELYLKMLHNGELMHALNKEEAKKGDVFFIPAGRVHTLGKGLLVAEIQQASDITYRIYDYDRRDANGKRRTLHTEEALEALDFKTLTTSKTQYTLEKNRVTQVVKCVYFTTNILDYTQDAERSYHFLDSFVIHICVEGAYLLSYQDHSMAVRMGQCVLIPAAIKDIRMQTTAGFKILESYIEEPGEDLPAL